MSTGSSEGTKWSCYVRYIAANAVIYTFAVNTFY